MSRNFSLSQALRANERNSVEVGLRGTLPPPPAKYISNVIKKFKGSWESVVKVMASDCKSVVQYLVTNSCNIWCAKHAFMFLIALILFNRGVDSS